MVSMPRHSAVTAPRALVTDVKPLAADTGLNLAVANGYKAKDRQQRLVIISISIGLLLVLPLGILALEAFGLSLTKGLAWSLVLGVWLILAGVLASHLRHLFRLGAIEPILGEAFQATLYPQAVADARGNAVITNNSYNKWINPELKEDSRQRHGVEAALAAKFGENPQVAAEFEKLRKAAHAGNTAQNEIPVIKNGKIQEWRRVIVRPLSTGHIVWRLEDVSGRKRAEQAVREEQNKLVDFMAHAPVGIYSVDQLGRFRLVNRTLAEWLGYKTEELTSGQIKLHDVFAKKPEHVLPHAITAGQEGETHGSTLLRSKNGRVLPVSITQTIVHTAGGKSLRTRSIVRDLTPEKSWQEALSLSEQRFHRLFDEAPIGIALLRSNMVVDDCNQAFLHLVRLHGDAVIKKSFLERIPDDQRGELATRLYSVLDGNDVTKPIELRGLGDPQTLVFVYAKRFALLANETEGQENGVMLYFIDYTDQKRIEAQLAHSVKLQAIGQLAGGVAHDFNNLLTAMIGFCDLLLQRHKPGDQSFADIMQIKQNGNRAANLVRQLLAFSRQQTLQPKVLHVTDVLAELANLLRRLIGANISLQMVHARDVGLIKADQGQLEQVIINLVVNARDAMLRGGVVLITTSNHHQETPVTRGQDMMLPGDYVRIEVQDHGDGIPSENLQRIFEPFFSTKEIGSGTGLGLSTVYGIVRQTGGFIEVDSEVNKGSCFTVYLPIYVEKDKAEAARLEEPKEKKLADLTGAGTILLVEDEAAVRVFSARALTNKGYRVLEARGGEEALEILEKEGAAIDLIISDVVMPGMDGPTLVRQALASKPDAKVIFISGYTEDRFREQLKEGEVVHFLAKPFSLKQLAGKVKEVLTGEVEE